MLLRFMFLLLVTVPAFGLNPVKFSFSWPQVQGAGAYRVEIGTNGKVLQTVQLNQPPASFLLMPGPYEFRLTTIDRFMKDEGVSPWTPFHVEADRPPLVNSLSPQKTTWPFGAVLTFQATEMAVDVQVKILGPNQYQALLPAVVAGATASVTLPPGLPPGDYQVALLNPPTRLAPALVFHINNPVPQITQLSTSQVRVGYLPTTLTLTGTNFMPTVNVHWNLKGKSLELPLLKKSFTELVLGWPAQLPWGQGKLEVSNGQDAASAQADFWVKGPYHPHADSLSMSLFHNSQIPAVMTLKGGDFAPPVKVSLARLTGFLSLGGEYPVKLLSHTETTLTFEIDERLPLGLYQVRLVNEPGKPETPGPLLNVLEDPISRQWEYALYSNIVWAVGDWAHVYSWTPLNQGFETTYFFTPHKRPILGSVWDFGLTAQGEWLSFPHQGYSDVALSSLWNISVLGGPVVEYTQPTWSVRLALEGGAGFTDIEITLPNILAEKLVWQDIMPFVGASLEGQFPITDAWRLQGGLVYRMIVYQQPLQTLGLTLKAVWALPGGKRP